MQYDVAVQTVIDLNERYKPFAIYADKGAGEYSPPLGVILIENKPKSVKPKTKVMVIPR